MSSENVEVVRCLQPRPEMDLADILNNDEASRHWINEVAPYFDPSVQGTMCFDGMAPVSYSGLDGLRDAWRDWLRHWVSLRAEIEDIIDAGENVVVVHCNHGRHRPEAPEITLRLATVFTLRNRLVVHVDFNRPYDAALTADV